MGASSSLARLVLEPSRLLAAAASFLSLGFAVAQTIHHLAAIPIAIGATLLWMALIESGLILPGNRPAFRICHLPVVASLALLVSILWLDQLDPARLARREARYRLSDEIEYGIDFENVGGLQACELRTNIAYWTDGRLYVMPNRNDVGGCIPPGESIGPLGQVNQPADRFVILRVTVCYVSRGRVVDAEKRSDFYYYYQPGLPGRGVLPHASSEHIETFLYADDPRGIVPSLDSCSRRVRPRPH
jgi:hypothetical protein